MSLGVPPLAWRGSELGGALRRLPILARYSDESKLAPVPAAVSVLEGGSFWRGFRWVFGARLCCFAVDCLVPGALFVLGETAFVSALLAVAESFAYSVTRAVFPDRWSFVYPERAPAETIIYLFFLICALAEWRLRTKARKG